MDFIDQIKLFSKKVQNMKDNIQTEEATKTSIIMPFFSLLGYDVFNLNEFTPEFSADVGIKGEKVDYAIIANGEPIILIECKSADKKLKYHYSQLFKYFSATKAKFAILTNGFEYQFFSDLDAPNKMDAKPFLEINILNLKDNQIKELKKFHKANFNVNKIVEDASVLKYSNEFETIFAKQLENPCDEFVKFFLSIAYDKQKTKKTIDNFRPILKKSLNNYINELMNKKIKSALESESSESSQTSKNIDVEIKEKNKNSKIITTDEELEAYVIVKTLLSDIVNINDITYKDTERYFAITYKNKSNCWILRLYLNNPKNKYVCLNVLESDKSRLNINSIYDIKNVKKQLDEIVSRFI